MKHEYRKDREERPHKQERGKKDESYRQRSDKARRKSRSRSPRDRHRDREEEDVKPNIKQEPRDRGYERVSGRHSEKNENVRIKQEIVMTVKEERQYNDERRRENKRHQPENPFQTTNNATQEEGSGANPPKEKPNFETSGALTEDTNTYRGVVIKYNEPPEARKPKRKWRFYIFKGDQQMPVLHVHRQSAYLLGRDRKIADIPVDHPSCSKQHAVLQYRLCEFTREDGTIGRRVRPYIIDLESANGTFLNNKQIEARRYYELQEKDVLKFAYSSRDYVLLHANSKDDEEDG